MCDSFHPLPFAIFIPSEFQLCQFTLTSVLRLGINADLITFLPFTELEVQAMYEPEGINPFPPLALLVLLQHHVSSGGQPADECLPCE